MGRRGPKSAVEQQIVAVEFQGRPKPPRGLNERQKEIWDRTIISEAPSFFCTFALQDMLADYCRHRERAETLGATINEFEPEWAKSANGARKLKDLLKMRDGESRAAADKATKLRMTNQSRYTPQTGAAAASAKAEGPEPWED